ncbi:MLO-like protein 3 [Primulina huaijiensis]|uniref:MLO-like protein 3 n=1 Tax=Primulina huaijiensis TaxID=1492673 RepID=UPI003CC79391
MLPHAQMKRWKAWEKETLTVEYMAANDPERFRYARQTTFGRRHVTSYGSNSPLLWIKCFLRQFFRSVAKIDYLTLRHGFISAHLSTNNSFNFQKYIQRSLEDDFKAVVGISPVMWFVVVIFLLVDVHGWNAYLWVSFLPLIAILVIGTKLEVIVARMAMQLTNQNTVIKGSPLVQPNNNLFWFNRPQLVLTLLHFILFMNAFEFSFFIWVTWQFGIKSCYHENVEVIVIRVVLAIMVQILCSYITLPLYALVTQMGSQFKSAILEEHTIHKIKQWHEDVKHKRKKEPNSPEPTVHSHSEMVSLDEGSSHRRAPTLMVFGSPNDVRGDEITEVVDDHQHTPQGIQSRQISKNELHIVHQRI